MHCQTPPLNFRALRSRSAGADSPTRTAKAAEMREGQQGRPAARAQISNRSGRATTAGKSAEPCPLAVLFRWMAPKRNGAHDAWTASVRPELQPVLPALHAPAHIREEGLGAGHSSRR